MKALALALLLFAAPTFAQTTTTSTTLDPRFCVEALMDCALHTHIKMSLVQRDALWDRPGTFGHLLVDNCNQWTNQANDLLWLAHQNSPLVFMVQCVTEAQETFPNCPADITPGDVMVKYTGEVVYGSDNTWRQTLGCTTEPSPCDSPFNDIANPLVCPNDPALFGPTLVEGCTLECE